jgi:tRNA-dihydrouridine synthase A
VAALLGRRPPDAGHVDRVLEALVDYAEREVAAGERPHRITRHLQGLFRGQPGARDWRRLVTLDAQHPRFDLQTLLRFRAAA